VSADRAPETPAKIKRFLLNSQKTNTSWFRETSVQRPWEGRKLWWDDQRWSAPGYHSRR